MAQMYYDDSIDLAPIKGKRVAIIGYGSQGHAHALNLRDSGVEVRVGLPPSSKSIDKAREAGLEVTDVKQAAEWGNVVMLLTPDVPMAQLYATEVGPVLEPGEMLMFAHGFNVHYKTIVPRTDIDVSLVAPKAPGHRVRELFVEGGGTPALFAIHQDASGNARPLTLSYARGIGSARAGVLETTFAEETETDLFGEQAVLCGGVSWLIKAGFETLVEAGYQPELAYFECLHELKLMVDLMYKGGLNFMRYSISDTAEYGDYVAGPQIVTDETRAVMRKLLAEIQSGEFAKKWIAENGAGRPWFNKVRSSEQDQPIEEVGQRLRALMPFLSPVAVKQPTVPPQTVDVPSLTAGWSSVS